ncbi:MAG TPA: chromosome segregation protein SMC [Phycisphaerae bacterium]|nr:chromosome segregation protein SMC [Phycisphaerae bacterium]HRR83674.1 chromosome segregation protein SMC [Phycisphaerae bacterium]
MFLKRLTCQGFKSFADKTDFDFLPGVTGIVGPNGCGKSNVVDSIKWVLGDQSARSLRGKQMMDVIFNGSGTRKSAGMAQVDLLFDNTDRKLARDTDEVTITRRLYRSGESEYLINNEQCRLRDIRELFLDTGVGVGAYSIIEQGKVDILLQANPIDRRHIFEEAAGISRYKARKKEAERKLERVEQNLLRLEDIVEEVERRLRSIKYQAGKARSFQEYDRKLREKRAAFSMAEYHRLSEKRALLAQEEARLEDEVTRLRTAISSAETRSSALDGDLMVLDGEVRQIEQQILTNASEITANTERIEQSRQRIEELIEVRSRAQQRHAMERQRAARLRQQLAAEQADLDQLEDRINAARAAVESLAVQDRQLAEQLTGMRARSDDDKAGVIDLMRRSAQISNEIQALAQRRQHLEAEKARLQARRQQVETELAGLRDARGGIDARAAEVAEEIRSRNEQLDELKQRAAQLDLDRAELNGRIAAAKEYRSGLLSRRQVLMDLEQQLEGVDAGVRELLHRKERDATGKAFAYVRGMVADLIAVDVANATLIEIALGEYDQYLVVEDSEAFFRDAELFADFPGRVKAICIDRLPPFVDGRDFTQQEGFVAYAMDVIRFQKDAERLVRHLLGKTIIVRTLADAIRMAGQNPPGYRYVTLTGELLDPLKAHCEMGPAGGRTGLISRKSELREIDVQLEEVDERIDSESGRLEETSTEMVQIEQAIEDQRRLLNESLRAEVEIDSLRHANENAVQRLMQEQPLIHSEMAAIDRQIAEATEKSNHCSQALSRLESENVDREERIRRLDAQIAVLSEERSRLSEQMTQARVAVAELMQRRSLMAGALHGTREACQASEEAVRSAARESEDSAGRIAQAERMILSAESRLAELYSLKEQRDADLLARQRRRQEIRLEIEQLAARTKVERSSLNECEEKLHLLRMESQEARIRIEDLVARVRDELGVDLAESYANYQHREQEQDWAAVEAEIEELKLKIQRLGNVNLDAIAEQEELEKRSDFLGQQRADLRTSQKQLTELIEHLNQECRERFTQTFETVRGHFQELFRKLFGGGKADIILEQPPEGQPLDVLEAGIEIQARPPGKELQSISLLSGGEKTMTAIALLLSIFRSRPSPFAILDEVDAALDEANNERFNRIVGEFLDKSQFIIITHSKRTMGIADVLYGITMQEAGVSKRVSVRFDSTEDHIAAA